MTARNRVAMAARWLKVASGYLQFHARRRALIVALVQARHADEDASVGDAGGPVDPSHG